ncbi:alanine racemase [Microbacterium sp. ASV81]|uniref:Alanine racemase n=1 Tax=Microbacterium capsulatum TaxID=3041921 RepID=A0ABU0XC58_9MICO|nr:alanine racemase [Microbacterium sp. ASV81]MDQ4212694.1 alanine racemase [Microbacterium sp. ASV81]
MTRPVLRVDEAVLRANIAAVTRRVEPAELMMVVKDDGYGLGARWSAEVAADAGVGWIGTYDIPTAVRLREVVGAETRLFAWVTSDDEEIADALLADVDLGVGSLDYLRRVIERAGALGVRARIHLKVDTGLHRNGLAADEWDDGVALALRAQGEGRVVLVGAWSHLAEASDAEDDDAQARFLAAVERARVLGAELPYVHLTASAATWARPELRGTLVRVGAFCYGIRSADGPDLPGIAPAAELVAMVERIEGDEVVVGIGSFDGLPSILAGRVEVGTPAGARPLRRIDPDSARVAAWEGAAVGDEVVLFGRGGSGDVVPTTLAEAIGTVGEEILCRLTAHVRREQV